VLTKGWGIYRADKQAKAIEDQLDALESKLAVFLEAYGDGEEPASAGHGSGSKAEDGKSGETKTEGEGKN
jgi:hypothetical protein